MKDIRLVSANNGLTALVTDAVKSGGEVGWHLCRIRIANTKKLRRVRVYMARV